MITETGLDTSEAVGHKFSEPMSAYLYELDLLGEADESAGSTDDGPGVYASRFGRRVLTIDSHGFTYYDRFHDVAAAERAVDVIRAMELLSNLDS